MPFDTFISYSSKDKTVADTACAALELAGVRCWMAPRDIRAGTEYAEGIIEGIDASRLMVLIFSSSANASRQIHREIERAVSKGLTIIPFRIEDTLPTRAMEYYLGSIHWLDALTPPLTQHVGQLVEQVKANLQVGAAGDVAPPPVFEKLSATPVAAARSESVRSPPRRMTGLVVLAALIGLIGALGVAAFLLWRSPGMVITRSPAFGGPGGAAFDDLDDNDDQRPISALRVIVNLNPADRTQRIIGGLQARWGNKTGRLHGGQGPNAQRLPELIFAQNEIVGRVDVNWGTYNFPTSDNRPPEWVAGLKIWTNIQVHTFGDVAFGRTERCMLGNKEILVGFFGRSGSYIDQLGCIAGKGK